MINHYIPWKCIVLLEVIIQFSNGANNSYAILIFSQQWPKTVCATFKKPGEKCNLPKTDEWTIHGIWPSKKKQIVPSDCRSDLPFKRKELDNIREELKNKWINIKNKNSDEFWEREWEKHGTCSVDLNSMNSQMKYFRKGIESHNGHNIMNKLQGSGISPGRNYPIQQILDALQRKFGFSVQVTCYKLSGKQYLQEIRICFNKAFDIISCKDYVDPLTNCNQKMNVEYPNTVSK